MSDHEHDRQGDGHDGQGADSALAVVSALMEERRKYESWLEALEARRGATPERVFERVHGDYSARLDVVLGELGTHSGGLRAELASLTSRLSELEDQQQHQRDERAEAELRAHVGELSPDAWQDVATAADRTIDELAVRHGELERELTRTRELLNEAERPATPRGAAAIPEAPAAPAPEPVVEPIVEPVPEPEPVHVPLAAVASAPPAPEFAAPGTSEMPVELPPAVIAAEAAIVEREAAAQPVVAERTDADVTPAPTQRADASRASGQTAGTFDELAFLSSVVNTPTGTVDVPAPTDRADERSRRDSFAQRASEGDIVNLSNDPGTMLEGTAPVRSSPLAMNVSGNIPIVIKDKTAEAAKSLKCGECGAMNYPTEWYCERCGAELASL